MAIVRKGHSNQGHSQHITKQKFGNWSAKKLIRSPETTMIKYQPEVRLLVDKAGQLLEYFPPFRRQGGDPDVRPSMEEWHSIFGRTGTGSFTDISRGAVSDEVASCNNGKIDCSSFSFMA